MKSFFDLVSGRREAVEITPLGEGGPRLQCSIRFFQVPY